MLSSSSRLHRLLFSLAVGLSAAVLPNRAVALGSPTDLAAVEPTPDDISQAAQYFDQGRDAFRSERYAEAAEAFEKADALAPNPKVLLLAIQSRELDSDLARASTLAALAEQRHPDDALFRDVKELLRKADASLHRVTVTCDTPCQVMVGNRLIHGPMATRRYLYLEAGKYRIRAAWSEGRSLAKYYEAKAGGRDELKFEAANETTADDSASDDNLGDGTSDAAPAPASEDDWADDDWGDEPATYDDPPDDPLAYGQEDGAAADAEGGGTGLSPWVFWTGASGTVILAGVSIWSGIDTINNPGKERVVRECAGLGESCPTYQQGLRNQDRTNILWGVTAGVGLLTTLIGTVWTDWGGSASDAPQVTGSLRIRPVLSIGGMTDAGSGIGAARINVPYLGAAGRF